MITGTHEVIAKIEGYKGLISENVKRAVNITCLMIAGEARKAIQRGTKSGTTYYRIPGDKYMTIRAGSPTGTPVAFVGGGGKKAISMTHKASKSGEAPATDTGQLVRMIAVDMDAHSAIGYVVSRARYSAYLEYGTSRIAPRPFFEPAFLAGVKQFGDIMRQEIMRGAR